jgi:hypothetical protein
MYIYIYVYIARDAVIFTQPNLRLEWLDGKPFNLRTYSSFRPAALHKRRLHKSHAKQASGTRHKYINIEIYDFTRDRHLFVRRVHAPNKH